MKLCELNENSDISLYAWKKDKKAHFNSSVIEMKSLEKDDLDYLRKTFKNTNNICVIQAIEYSDSLIKMDEQGVSFNLLATFDAKPYLWQKVAVPKLQLPILGYVHVLWCANDGQPFNRRDSFRLWLGVEGICKMGDSRATHTIIVKDISEKGIGFLYDKKHKLKLGSVCNVQFFDYVYSSVKKENVPVKYVIICTVVRIVDIDENTALAGCSIEKTANNIARFIARKQQERLRTGGRKELYHKDSDESMIKDTKLS